LYFLLHILKKKREKYRLLVVEKNDYYSSDGLKTDYFSRDQ